MLDKKNLAIVLFPIVDLLTVESLLEYEKNKIILKLKTDFGKITLEEINKVISNKISNKKLKDLISEIDNKEYKKYYSIANDIYKLLDSNISTLKRLGDLAKLLQINEDETGYDFNIFNYEEIQDNEFSKAVRNFSSIAAVVGFMPLPIADLSVLSVMQIGMVSKIANIYDFDMDPKQFIQLISGTIGAGFVFRWAAKIIFNFVPVLGWAVNASIAFIGTYSIGVLAKEYAKAKGKISQDSMSKLWEEAGKTGKSEFAKLKNTILKTKDTLLEEFNKYKDEYNSDKENENTKDKDAN